MSASELQQSLLSAVELLSEKAANSTNAAITIKGEIVEELDSGLHKYSVSYGGAVYKDAYAAPGVTYPISSIVYLLVPDGNFDKPKIILGSVTPVASNFVTEQETDMYIPLSSNLFGKDKQKDLKSWRPGSSSLITTSDIVSFKNTFSQYLNSYRDFAIYASIKTNILKDYQCKGNYGIVLILPFLQEGEKGLEQTIRTFVIDVNNIQGNPYALNEYQKVVFYGHIDNTLTYDKNRNPEFYTFVNGFEYGQYIPVDDAGEELGPDIHIKDISIKMVDVLSETEMSGYHLSVVASEGHYFLTNSDAEKKTLTPILKAKGKTVKNLSDWDCYWFLEDLSVNTTSNNYNPLGGLGWNCLNEKTQVAGESNFQYVTNKYNLEVSSSDVINTLKYKCVLVKTSEELVVSGEVELKQLNSNYELSLLSATGSTVFVENIGRVRLIAKIRSALELIYHDSSSNTGSNISTIWQRFDKNGNYINDSLIESDDGFYSLDRNNDKVNGWYETEISYPCHLVDKINTIKCTFYQTTTKNGQRTKKNLGTASINITTSAEMTYSVTIDGGDVLYKYDADGDSPMEGNYDGPLSSQIKTIQPLTFRVFKPDGRELDEAEYKYVKYEWLFPSNSMMKLKGFPDKKPETDGYYHITESNSINYSILSTFNKKKNDNTVLINIDFDNNHFSASTNPKFLKDGQGGTNGSKYAAIVTYNNFGYNEKDDQGRYRKFHGVYVNGEGWYQHGFYQKAGKETLGLFDFGQPQFGVKVYKDGQILNSGYTVSWSIYDDVTQNEASDTIANSCFSITNSSTGILSVKREWTDPTSIYCSTVKCEVKIQDKSSSNDNEEILRAYYPLEITRLRSNTLATTIIPTLVDGYEEVVYASDGTNPQYDNTNPFRCIDSVYDEEVDKVEDYLDYVWSYSSTLRMTGENGGPIATIKPATKYSSAITQNYVKVVLITSQTKSEKTIAKINENKAMIKECEDYREFYQDNKNYILAFQENFVYNNYKEQLEKTKLVLDFRYNLIDYINQLKGTLEELKSYCNEHGINSDDFNYHYEYLEKLNIARNAAYLLGSSAEKNFDTLVFKLEIPLELNFNTIKDKYGVSVAQQLDNYTMTWESFIRKYEREIDLDLNSGDNIKRQYDTSLDELVIYNNNLKDLVNNENLEKLLRPEGAIKTPEVQYQQLYTELSILYNKVIDYLNGDLISYSAFRDDLEQLKDIMFVYNDTKHINKMYNLILDNLNFSQYNLEEENKKYSDLLIPTSTDSIIHIKPIVMLYNTYEFGNINAWDGTKLYIDPNNNEYLLAPQIGAGIKDKNNAFTGMLMGIRQFNEQSTQHVGLFGYDKGVQSMFLNAKDGSAIFGKNIIMNPGQPDEYREGSQIIIDPSTNQSLLYSSNFWDNYGDDGKPNGYSSSNETGKGMLINLTKPEIRYGNGNFSVSEDGSFKSIKGYIGGWTIDKTMLYSKNKGKFLALEVPEEDYVYDGYEWYTTAHVSFEPDTLHWVIYCVTKDVNAETNPDETIYYVQAIHNENGVDKLGKVYKVIEDKGESWTSQDTGAGTHQTAIRVMKDTDSTSSGTGEQFYQDGKLNELIARSSSGDHPECAFSSLKEYIKNKPIYAHYKKQNSKIYSEKHYDLDSTKEGFYLSNDGLSIHNTIRITSEDGGKILVGRLDASSGKHWIICGETDSNNGSVKRSYISYNTTEKGYTTDDHKHITISGSKNQIYMGTDGFRLGKTLVVDPEAEAGLFNGRIEAKEGYIGADEDHGWIIESKGFTYTNKSEIYPYNGKDYYKAFVVEYDGDVGTRLVGKDNPNDIISDYETIEKVLKKSFWTLKSNGTIYCETAGSRLGGVFVEDSGTVFVSKHGTSTDRENGVFQYSAQDEIEKIVKNNVHFSVIYNGEILTNVPIQCFINGEWVAAVPRLS